MIDNRSRLHTCVSIYIDKIILSNVKSHILYNTHNITVTSYNMCVCVYACVYKI